MGMHGFGIICLQKCLDMIIYNTYEKTDTTYEFVDENENVAVYPISSVILVDDDSNMLSIKLVASRATVGLVRK